MPTYITIKDVKKRWGKGQEDIYPVTQFEKLWGDMTTLPGFGCGLRCRVFVGSSSKKWPSWTAGCATGWRKNWRRRRMRCVR